MKNKTLAYLLGAYLLATTLMGYTNGYNVGKTTLGLMPGMTMLEMKENHSVPDWETANPLFWEAWKEGVHDAQSHDLSN